MNGPTGSGLNISPIFVGFCFVWFCSVSFLLLQVQDCNLNFLNAEGGASGSTHALVSSIYNGGEEQLEDPTEKKKFRSDER